MAAASVVDCCCCRRAIRRLRVVQIMLRSPIWGKVSMVGYLPNINGSLVGLHCTLFFPGNRTGQKEGRVHCTRCSC
jgi:hypothetical protein